MITGRVIGGIIALVGGALVVVACLLNTDAMVPKSNSLVAWVVSLIIGLWAIAGGILGLYKKGTGSLLALIAGIAAILCELLYMINPARATYLALYFPLDPWTDFVVLFTTLVNIIIAAGGIVIFANKK